MYIITFTENFDKSFSNIKNNIIKKQISNKIFELEKRAPIGKKLKGNSYWSIHINSYRVIYEIKGENILIIELLKRKKNYTEL